MALAGARDVDLAVQAARGAFEDGWSSLRPAERAKYLFRIARLIQERSRELAVAESLDGGKPIKESRDVDIPLAAAHFFYYAGWADKLEYAFPNRRPRPLGVAGQIIPWNFPLLMLAWKIAPALACGNTVVLKPAETTPLTALIFTDICRQAELPAGVVNIITGDGSTGAHLVKHPDLDKVAFTGSTEVGKAIQRELAGTGTKLTLELGGKAANIVFDDCALDQAVEGIVNGIYFNQGHVCCAGSRLLVQESIYEPLVAKLKRRLRTIRVGDPLDKNTDLGAINSRMQLDRIRELVAAGTEEGAEMYQPPCRLPEKGYWFAPTVFTNVAQSSRIAQEEIFGPVLSVLTFRTPEEARREGEQHAVRPLGRRLDGEGLAHPLDGRAPPRRRRLGEHVQPVRSDLAVRRLQGIGLRPRGRAPRARAVPEVRPMSRIAVRKTYKLYIGGAFPRSESGRTYEAEGQNVAWASRKDARDAVKAARGAFAKWAGATPYNRGQVLYRLAEMMETRATDLARACSGRREVERAIDRVVWYAGWADKLPQVLGGSNPVAGPVLQLHRARADRRRRGAGTRAAGARGARLPHRPGDRERQHHRRRRVGDAAARGPRARGGDRHLRPARRRRQPAHRLPRRAGADPRLAHGRQRDRRHGRRRRHRRARGARRRQRQARRPCPQRAEPLGDLGVPRAQDRSGTRSAPDAPVDQVRSAGVSSCRFTVPASS